MEEHKVCFVGNFGQSLKNEVLNMEKFLKKCGCIIFVKLVLCADQGQTFCPFTACLLIYRTKILKN